MKASSSPTYRSRYSSGRQRQHSALGPRLTVSSIHSVGKAITSLTQIELRINHARNRDALRGDRRSGFGFWVSGWVDRNAKRTESQPGSDAGPGSGITEPAPAAKPGENLNRHRSGDGQDRLSSFCKEIEAEEQKLYKNYAKRHIKKNSFNFFFLSNLFFYS